jgi:hypothetical protein
MSSKVLLILVGIVSAALFRVHAQALLDAAAIGAAVRDVAEVFEREYFDAALSKTVAEEIKRRLDGGRYASANEAAALAKRLTADFYELTNDKHIAVALAIPRAASGGERRNIPTTAGFRRTELIAGNIGVFDLAFFMRPVEHRDALAAAMEVLHPAVALIIDMRANGGGSPDTVALFISYLIEGAGQPLFEIVHRDGSKEIYRTPEEAPATRNARRPIYVLTSSKTFSGGEGLAFLLQELKRAVVIGEVTAGAANPGRPYPVGELFEITVPNGRVVTAITKRNWEGSGVTPDISVPAADAFRVAHLRALDDVIAATVDPTRLKELHDIRADLAKR